MTESTVYAVASGKGGVGKTTTAINLGAGCAHAGRSVVVVDLDLGMANLADFIEATPAGPTLHDVLAGEATLDDALSHAEPNLDVILGSDEMEDFGKADPTEIRPLLSDLRERYDVVILDSGGGLSHDSVLPLGLADHVILVSTMEGASIENTKKTLELAERLEGSIKGLVLTRVGGGETSDPTTIASELGVRLLGAVPEDSTVPESAEAGQTTLAIDPNGPAATAYLEIAYDLLDEPLPTRIGESEGRASGLSVVESRTQSTQPSGAPDDSVAAAAERIDSGEEDDPTADSETDGDEGSGEVDAGESTTETATESTDEDEAETEDTEVTETTESEHTAPSLLARLTGGLFG
jgi:septum site-determining protein MinD